MRRLAYRIGFVSLLVVAPAGAEPPPMTATLQCDRAVEPGRIRCTVEARALASHTLQWADVVIVELPDFTQALKGRLAANDSIARDTTSERWAFGLVAKKTGEGEAKVKVRAILCDPSDAGDAGPPRCAPVTVEARAPIHVG